MFKLQNNLPITLQMTKIHKYLFILSFIFTTNLSAEINSFFKIGEKNFKQKKFDLAKLNFEKDIVRNTKNVKSYLYLAKIHQQKKNTSEFEKNLNTVLLLEPKNEEALYLLIKKKIDDADFDNAKLKINLLKDVCKNFCGKIKELEQLNKNSRS